MHIAVLIYGRLNRCAEHYNNIIEHLGNNEIDFFLSSDNSSESLLNDFVHLYKPIAYTNEEINYDNSQINKYPIEREEVNSYVIHNIVRHYINKSRVLSLFDKYMTEHDIKYDVAVSLRIDCLFQNSFNFDNLLENTIYIPAGFDYVYNGINDQVAYGKVDVMKKYNSIFHNMFYLLDNKLSILHSESLHYANIQFYKLQIQRPTINYNLDR